MDDKLKAALECCIEMRCSECPLFTHGDCIAELEERIAIMQESMEALEKRCNALEALEQRCKTLEALEKRNEWVSVKDKLPELGKNVLVYIERNAYRFDEIIRKREIAIGWHMEGRWHVDGCSGVVGLYWQELPEPPKEVSE